MAPLKIKNRLSKSIAGSLLCLQLFIPLSLQADAPEAIAPQEKLESLSPNIFSKLLTKDRRPTPLLRELLILTGIEGPHDDLEAVIQKTQARWVAVNRGKNLLERRDLMDSETFIKNREAILAVAQNLGLFEASSPSKQHYHYAVCLGAFLNTVRDRLNYLIKLWEQGVRFDSLVFLGGERDLRKEKAEPDSLLILSNPLLTPLPIKKDWQMPKDAPYATEYDMMKMVWDQADIPASMREALENKVIFVNTPKGAFSRPSTGDTYAAWLSGYHPKPGSVLAVSSSVFWPYQQMIALNHLGNDFSVETVAPAAVPENQKVIVVLDTIAKCLYEMARKN